MNSFLLYRRAAQAWLYAALLALVPAGAFAGQAADYLEALAGPAAPVYPAPAPVPQRLGRALNAWFIDVGQGDSEYIELPNGANVLIDGGPIGRNGPGSEPPLAKFLTQHGVTHINYMVLTHPHADHFTGLKYVFDHMQVDNFYDTREDNPGAPTLGALRAEAAGNGHTRLVYPAAGDSLDWDPGEVRGDVLNSCQAAGQSTAGNVLNDCSIVLKVAYNGQAILYTGDMQNDVEARLVSQYGAALKADVLKVGHHGSRTASSAQFLAQVQPKWAYIEVGAGNSFGHPTQEALGRLQAAGATVFRTDLNGTSEYTISGN